MASANKRKKQPTTSNRVYCGELQYSIVDEQIEVTRFIVREDTISFDLLTEWGLGGNWHFDGVAKQLPDGAFLSDPIEGRKMIGNAIGHEKSVLVPFRFEIQKQSDSRIQISGMLFLRGEENRFAGTLKKLTSKNRP
jgi:hypothetical protein